MKSTILPFFNKHLKKICILYVILLAYILLFKGQLSPQAIADKINSVKWNRELGIYNINLVPFRSILEQTQNAGEMWAVKNLLGNIVLFVPLGFLLPLSFQKMQKFLPTFFTGLLFILCIETIQFFSMLGIFDIDDILLNSLGTAIGYILFYIIMHRKS